MADTFTGYFSPPDSDSDDENGLAVSSHGTRATSPAMGQVNGHAKRIENGRSRQGVIDDEKNMSHRPDNGDEGIQHGGEDVGMGDLSDDDEEDSLVMDDDAVKPSSPARPSIRGGSEMMRMVLLNLNAVGMTFTWGVEMTYCTPYLLSLGLTKGQTSMVWIAGPLSGLIMQPLVGAISDNSTSRWGRRRPVIVAASIIVTFSLVTLGFTKEIVGLLIKDRNMARIPTIVLAVLALYATDFAINAVMSCSRSLMVDTLPTHKQQAGAAWSSRMASVGHISGYGMGAIDLVGVFGTTLGDTQFKKLILIAAALMVTTSAVTCWAVKERVFISPPADALKSQGRLKVVRQIWTTLRGLPPRIQAICWAVFWSWIGWYPFLIYSSTWVGEIYFRYDVPDSVKDSKDALGDMGRIGSSALTVYSIVTFSSAWILPLFVKAPDDDDDDDNNNTTNPRRQNWFTQRLPPPVVAAAKQLKRAKPDLLTAWFVSNLIFAAAMSLAPFASSFRFATVLVAICGLPWTIAMWAPTAFLGIEVNKLSGGGGGSYHPSSATAGQTSYRRLSAGSAVEMTEASSAAASSHPHLEHGSSSSPSSSFPRSAGRDGQGQGELSGIYFGILNIYTTLPQFAGTFISTVIFAVLEPGKSPELATDAHPSEHHGTNGPNAIAICLFIGAVSAVGAAYATRRLRAIP